MKIGINTKLVMLSVLLVIISCLVVGIVGYKSAETAFNQGVKDRLQDQSKDWKLITESYTAEISAQELRVRSSAKTIVSAQTYPTYELIRKALDDNGGALNAAQKDDILKRLNTQVVGKTGYIWILDYQGYYVLSKGRQRDGENIWETKDSDGNMVIQDLVGIGKALRGNEIGYHSYPWLNIGETVPREKIAAMVHFPELGWVVGVSTYYDDLVDMGYRKRTIEHVKDEMAKQLIGASGYIWVVDGNGVYVVSKNRLRDGEDISQSKDANGVFFIQEAVKKAKAAEAVHGTDIIEYPWLNKGETTPRVKVAGLTYVPELDWVIGVSAYYDDFTGKGALSTVKKNLIIISAIVLIIGVLISFFLANGISKPIKKMTAAGNKIADGDLDAEIPAVKTNDEVQDLATTMNLLVGALKFLKKEKKK